MRALVIALWLTPAAFGQFAFSVRTGGGEQPAGAVYPMGAVYRGESVSAQFRLRNVSGAPAVVPLLAADGVGFTLTGVPSLPVAIEADGFVDFSVVFRAQATGSYSAALHTVGASVLLTVRVDPSLTYAVDGALLGVSPMVFGPVERPAVVVRRVRIENLEPQGFTVPAITVEGAGFRLAGGSPSGTVLQPRDSAGFDVEYAPASAGAHEGVLAIGDRRYVLRGSASDPPLPKATVAVTLDEARSGRQGTVAVRLESTARIGGSGTLTLEFTPLAAGASDPAIAFASGAREVAFSVSPGDTEPLRAAFQTGTTAGTLAFVVSLGGVVSRQTIAIAAAPVAIVRSQVARAAGSLELQVAGFDNARAAGAVSYTFFDAAGSVIAAFRADHTAEFARFFATSDAGGNFVLRSVFPVTGEASRIAAYEVSFTTPAGVSSTGRLLF